MIQIHHSIPGFIACGFVSLLAGCATTDSFSNLDTNRDRAGSPAEFDSYMKKEVFTRVDSNRDAKVTKTEWREFNPKVSDTKFNKTDTDRDGTVNRQEADAAFDREGSLEKLFGKIDADLNGSLSPAEVSAFKSKVQQQPGSSPAEKITQAATQP